MTIVSLEQGSEEWKKWRTSKVMATDVPVILGSNPWKSKLELWEEKLGLRPPTQLNAAMKRGQDLEPEARKLASDFLGMDFEPCVYQCDKYPWLAASLDGISINIKDPYVLEIKCPKESTHIDATNDIIPEYYMDQIQTQLLVIGAQICYYFSYRPEYKEKPYAIIPVHKYEKKQQEIIDKGQGFYIQMCRMDPPEEWVLKKKD